jgi:hypothetical protein
MLGACIGQVHLQQQPGNLFSHKSPDIDQIPAAFITAGGGTLCEICTLVVAVWNKEELPEKGKELNVVSIYKNGDKLECSNYRDILLLPATYKILPNILLSRLTPYAEEIIGDLHCGFQCNRSTVDHIFCIYQIRG